MKSNTFKALVHGLILSLSAGASLAFAEGPEPFSSIESITQALVFKETATAHEWRDDWVKRESTEQAPFYNYFIGSMCDESMVGNPANVVEGIQRFKSKETIAQFQGEFVEGLSAMSMTSPLIWQGAKATAQTGQAAISQLYGLGYTEQSPYLIPNRFNEPRVPKGSRLCSTALTLEQAQSLLSGAGFWDKSSIEHFSMSRTSGEPSILGGELSLAKGIFWSLVTGGDGVKSILSLSSSNEPSITNATWDEISNQLSPLGLRFDFKATYNNEASEYRQRTWAIPDGRWISLTYQSGPMLEQRPLGNSSLLLSVYPQ